MEKERRKLKLRLFAKKSGTFLKSVGVGVLKATPFGHVAAEIENNLRSEAGGKNKVDKTRFAVWSIVSLIFIMKFLNVITWDDLYKFVEIIFQVENN
jgi:hypothetical protein